MFAILALNSQLISLNQLIEVADCMIFVRLRSRSYSTNVFSIQYVKIYAIVIVISLNTECLDPRNSEKQLPKQNWSGINEKKYLNSPFDVGSIHVGFANYILDVDVKLPDAVWTT